MNPQLRRFALDLGPLFIFFIGYKFLGIFGATAVFMAAVAVALALDYLIDRRFSPVPVFTAVLVMIFGGLTLILKNDIFIKMKPTALYTLFGLTLLGGMYFNRLFLKNVLSLGFDLPDSAWRTLTLRYGLFFLALAAANEIVWRNFSKDFWVDFKVWGVTPLIFLFTLTQVPLLMRHQPQDAEKPEE